MKVCKSDKLADLTGELVEDYMTRLAKNGRAPNTLKKHHSAWSLFANWLFRRRYTRENIIHFVPRPEGPVRTKNKPRVLTIDELRAIFRATAERPLRDALLFTKGKRKGQLGTRVKEATRRKCILIGQSRRLLYRTAATTALRKEELERLLVCDIDFNAQPFPTIDLRVEGNKAQKEPRLFMVPSLARELQAWVKARGLEPTDRLFLVPDKLNNIFLKDAKMAGVALFYTQGPNNVQVVANVHQRDTGRPRNSPPYSHEIHAHSDRA